MLFVNVGTHTINVENVAAFIEEGEEIVAVFIGPVSNTERDRYSIRLQGEASQRMRAWLRKNAEGVREETPGFAISGRSD